MGEKFEPDFNENPEQHEAGPAFKSPEERKVTDRNFSQYLDTFCLPEAELKEKSILDIGAGLSDFSPAANERFKEFGTVVVAMDPIYQNLGESFEEFKKNAKKSNMEWVSKSRESDPETAYQKLKEAPYKVVGSHQKLPFADESFDLVLANNSITQYKDKEITKTALKEAVRMMKQNGEARIWPADLRWDWKKESLYVRTFEAPTPETRKEANELQLDMGPDKQMLQILKEIEESGINFYAVVKPPKHRVMPGRFGRLMSGTGPEYSLILRKDGELPHVSHDTRMRKLSFKDSPDGFHVPSETIDLKDKE